MPEYDVLKYAVICSVAFAASGLTFFSGFGLGTLLLPAFALFFPIGEAVALTAVVHFLNGLFKVALVGRKADLRVSIHFGIPAILAAVAGAWVLSLLAFGEPLLTYSLSDREFRVTAAKLVVGLLLIAFAAAELIPRLRDRSFGSRYLPLGGLLSGFFGGLTGMQGALRSAFIRRAGLSKEAFVATGAVLACLIDLSRLGVYATSFRERSENTDYGLLIAAILSAFAGAALGNRFLTKITLEGVQRIVAAMLVVAALGLIAGVL